LNIRAGMTLMELVSMIFGFLLMVAGLAAFVMIVWGGVNYLTSAGDPSRTGDAKNQIFSAVLGLIIMLASWMILNTINPQLVELREPGLPESPQAGQLPPLGEGVCVDGQSYDVEIYSEKNFKEDSRFGCFNAGGSQAKGISSKILSIKINGSTSVKLFDEAGFEGRNICFKNSVPDLHRCILAGANDCQMGYAGWEKPKSLQVGAACSSPGTTLSAYGEEIWENCWFPPNEGFIPTCMYQ